jgi:hypothetical protein
MLLTTTAREATKSRRVEVYKDRISLPRTQKFQSPLSHALSPSHFLSFKVNRFQTSTTSAMFTSDTDQLITVLIPGFHPSRHPDKLSSQARRTIQWNIRRYEDYEILHPNNRPPFNIRYRHHANHHSKERGKHRHALHNNLLSAINLLRTRKTLHIPNPLKPRQILANISVAVVKRDELVVGIAAAPDLFHQQTST